MTALAASLQTYFTTFAHTQRDLSANTITSYRDTWRILIKYLAATLEAPADALDFDTFSATNVGSTPCSPHPILKTWTGRSDHALPAMSEALCVGQPIRSLRMNPQLAVIESLAAGIAVMASDVGFNCEYVADQMTGALAPPDDPSALNAAVERLIQDPARAAISGSNAAATGHLSDAGVSLCRSNGAIRGRRNQGGAFDRGNSIPDLHFSRLLQN